MLMFYDTRSMEWDTDSVPPTAPPTCDRPPLAETSRCNRADEDTTQKVDKTAKTNGDKTLGEVFGNLKQLRMRNAAGHSRDTGAPTHPAPLDTSTAKPGAVPSWTAPARADDLLQDYFFRWCRKPSTGAGSTTVSVPEPNASSSTIPVAASPVNNCPSVQGAALFAAALRRPSAMAEARRLVSLTRRTAMTRKEWDMSCEEILRHARSGGAFDPEQPVLSGRRIRVTLMGDGFTEGNSDEQAFYRFDDPDKRALIEAMREGTHTYYRSGRCHTTTTVLVRDGRKH